MGTPANTSDALEGHSARGKYFLEGGGGFSFGVYVWLIEAELNGDMKTSFKVQK